MNEENKNLKSIVRDAFNNNKVMEVYFYQDRSGCHFTLKNNVTNETRAISLPIEDALECLSGYRLKRTIDE